MFIFVISYDIKIETIKIFEDDILRTVIKEFGITNFKSLRKNSEVV